MPRIHYRPERRDFTVRLTTISNSAIGPRLPSPFSSRTKISESRRRTSSYILFNAKLFILKAGTGKFCRYAVDLVLSFFKSITATNRTDLQAERGKFGVPTVIQNRVRCLPAGSYLCQIKLVSAGIVLSEVEAESALSVMKLGHAETEARLGPHFRRLRIAIRSPLWKRSCHRTKCRHA